MTAIPLTVSALAGLDVSDSGMTAEDRAKLADKLRDCAHKFAELKPYDVGPSLLHSLTDALKTPVADVLGEVWKQHREIRDAAADKDEGQRPAWNRGADRSHVDVDVAAGRYGHGQGGRPGCEAGQDGVRRGAVARAARGAGHDLECEDHQDWRGGDQGERRDQVSQTPGRPLPCRKAAAAAPPGSASRTGSSAAPRRRGRGRGRGRRSPPSCGPSISSAGISSRKRDGTDAWPIPQVARRQACDRYSRRLRAGDPDVGEPALLLELLLVVERPAVREDALLEPGDEDDRELEALGGVERDQRHRVGVALVRVLVGDERGLLEQAVERVVGRQVVVAGRRPRAARAGSPSAPRRPPSRRRASPGSRTPRAPRRAARAAPAPRPASAAAGRAPRSRPARCASAARGPASSPRRGRLDGAPGRAVLAARPPRAGPRSSCRRCPRAGTLMIRSKLTLSVSERRTRR